MSWLFSQALVAEYSAGTCSDGGQSAQSNMTPTPQAYLWRDKTTAAWRRFPSGMTCEPLMGGRGEELLTLFRVGFPARTLASREKVQGLMGSAADCGQKWRGSLAKYDPDTHSLKTAQCSLIEDLGECSVTLPRSGLMRDGTCYLLPTVAPFISASASGSLLPTLTVCGNYNAKGASKKAGDGLATALAKRLPTLLASDSTKPRRGAGSIKNGGGKKLTDAVDPAALGGPLNPDWCEWFMGFPIGWTASAPLETHRFHEWRQQHGKC